MKIIIREGSAAKNFDALVELLHDYPDHIMFCSDDKHPDSQCGGISMNFVNGRLPKELTFIMCSSSLPKPGIFTTLMLELLKEETQPTSL
jgi:hypothetical protein